MRKMRLLRAVLLTLLVFFFADVPATDAQTTVCSKEAFDALGWKDEAFTQAVTITSAAVIAAAGTTPAYCKIVGSMRPEIGFEIYLPTANWNQRFQMTGCGGAAGNIPTSTMITYVRQNFAVAGTNMGHTGTTFDFTFAYNPPDNSNPNADQKVMDYGYRALHEVTVLAKKAIRAYYGPAPFYSYFNGSSCGGGRGMKNMQLYPEDFDGWVVGMPAFNRWNSMGMLWSAHASILGDGAIPVTKLRLLAEKVMDRCDVVDGVVDGLIEDPRRCPFNPMNDLPRCPDGTDATTCFTTAQLRALEKIYGGVKTGKFSLPEQGVSMGSEMLYPVGTAAISMWQNYLSGWDGTNPGTHINWGFSEGSYKYMSRPPLGPTWDWRNPFDFDDDYFKNAKTLGREAASAESVDLAQLKKLGRKVILFHGWSDQLIRPLTSIAYYEKLLRAMGEKEAKAFFKLYLVPGFGHGTSFGCHLVDWDLALRKWVENSEEPGGLIGTRTASTVMGTPLRTRPICPYPSVAKYKGSGSIEDAANFTCEKPTGVVSPNATLTKIEESKSFPEAGLNGISGNFKAVNMITFTATGVVGSADFTLDFGLLPENPVFYKRTKTGWWLPLDRCSGVSDVRFSGGILAFTMAQASECNLSTAAGTIIDPIVAGEHSGPLSSDGGRCFIATAAYGSQDHPHVSALRTFRDNFLLTFRMGQAFVSWYYDVSPSVVVFIGENMVWKTVAQVMLLPIVAFASLALALGVWPALLFVAFFVLLIVGLVVNIYVRYRRKPYNV